MSEAWEYVIPPVVEDPVGQAGSVLADPLQEGSSPKLAGNQLTESDIRSIINSTLNNFTQQFRAGNFNESFKMDPMYGLWLGAAEFSSASFSVTMQGLLRATGVIVSGSVTATSGAFGNWVIATNSFYSLASGTPTATPNNGIAATSQPNPFISVYEGTNERVRLGYLSSGIYGLLGYATNGTTKIFEMSDTQQMMAGWFFTDTVLRSGASDAASNVLIDSANSLIRLGPTSGNYITLDGPNLRIRTSTYTSGLAGFSITPTDAEFGNLTARGEFHSQVLSYNEIHMTAGTKLTVKSGAKLRTDFTSATSPTTFNIDVDDPDTGHVQVFAVGDILRIKDGSGNDNWFTVSSVSDQTTFFRYVCTKSNGTNATFKAGAGVADYGPSGAGGVLETADATNSPYISIFTHAGSPWSTLTQRVRLGNLSGVTDTVFGSLSGYGLWTDNIYLTGGVNATSGRFGTSTNYWLISSGVLVATGSGDVAIRAGQTDWNTGTGFWMGLKSGVAKVSFGDATAQYWKWDGTTAETSGSILPQMVKTAGEALSAGDFAVLRMGELVKQVASHDAIVKEGSAGTNFGTDTTAAMGSLNTLGTNDQYFFVKFDLSTIAVTTADKAFVRIGITSPQTPSWGDDLEVRVYQVTGADWDEGTITWTNMPAISASASDEYQTSNNDALTDDFIEESAVQAYIFVDITTLYNQWKAGSASNYGVCFRFVRRSTGTEHTTASRNITVATSENATSALQPTIIVAGVSDNVGKFYKGNSTTFTDLIGPGGFVKVGGSGGASVTVQREGIISNLTGLTQGKTHYINDSEVLSTTQGTLLRDVGYGLSTTELYYFDQPPRAFVDNIRYQQSNGASNRCDCTNRYFIPCGFKPKIIRFMGTAKIKSTVRAGFGTYQNGVQSTNTDDLLTSGYLIYYSPSGSEIAYLKVVSVSETGALIEVRQTDATGSASAASIVIEGVLSFEL